MVSVSDTFYPPPHPSTTADRTQGSQYSSRGLCSVLAGLVFPFGLKSLQKSLSRHYFWIWELDQGQFYPAHIVICLAYFLLTYLLTHAECITWVFFSKNCFRTWAFLKAYEADKLMAENRLKLHLI